MIVGLPIAVGQANKAGGKEGIKERVIPSLPITEVASTRQMIVGAGFTHHHWSRRPLWGFAECGIMNRSRRGIAGNGLRFGSGDSCGGDL